MLPEYQRPYLAEAEGSAARGDYSQMLEQLRRLGLDDFGLVLLNMPDPAYPALSRALPPMASERVQRDWTGAAGVELLRQSLNFTRIVRTQYEALTQRQLADAKILDYGCGYGRLLRLMMFFTDADRLAGCDPWDRSIDLCKEARIPCTLSLSDYLPTQLPFEDHSFDFIYAFSVFTHTSLRASETALGALRRAIKPDGVLVITIRPIEYWAHDRNIKPEHRALLEQAHRKSGFAFAPHNRAAVDGDVTYGDTSMTFNRLEEIARGWRMRAFDRSIDDPFQILVYLSPA